MAKQNNDRGRTKTPRALKANVKTYRVDKSKRSGTKKKDLFLAGTGKKQIASSAGGIRRDPRNRKKKKKKKTAEEHPLAKAFTDSLSQTTSHISAKMPQDLSDKLQIALSRITATTARSITYLAAASELKSRLFTSSPLLSASFREEIALFQELTREKRELLDGLWVEWVRCMGGIERLGRDEGILGRNDGEDLFLAESRDKGLDEATDGKEFDYLIDEIKAVGRAWSKKMENSEKKIANEALQQQQLAATVLL